MIGLLNHKEQERIVRLRLDEVEDYIDSDERDFDEEYKMKELILRKKVFKQGKDNAKTKPE